MSTIVIIEEDSFLAEGVENIIGAVYSDIRVEIADNGRDGLQLIRQTLPDLIFCDYLMPELSGLEVLEELKKSPATASIPFVLITASSINESDYPDLQVSFRTILHKPFEVNDIVQLVAHFIG